MVFALSVFLLLAVPDAGVSDVITVRTENYPRPPYSGATYFIYERAGAVICTKIETCNKYGYCESTYHEGAYKDVSNGDDEPFDRTEAKVISKEKLGKHVCLTRFRLLPR